MHINEFSSTLHGATIFSKLDLVQAFNQILVASEDVHKTAITTPLVVCVSIPFKLRNAAQTFQCFNEQVLQGLDFVYAYINDILVANCFFSRAFRGRNFPPYNFQSPPPPLRFKKAFYPCIIMQKVNAITTELNFHNVEFSTDDFTSF